MSYVLHLSVLLGSTLACTKTLPAALRMAAGSGAMALFLALAGAQPSVVRAVLMGAAALLIGESGHHSRTLGVLLITLVLMAVIALARAPTLPELVADEAVAHKMMGANLAMAVPTPIKKTLLRSVVGA